MTFSDRAFDDAGAAGDNPDGLATADAITSDTDATGGGVAAKALIKDSNGTEVFTCRVSGEGGGGDIEMNSAVISPGQTVSLTSLTYTAAP